MYNTTIKFACYVHEDSTRQPFEGEICGSVCIEELREVAEIRLSLDSPETYRFVLERDGKHLKVLDESKTLKSEQVQDGDKLVFFPSDSLPDSIILAGELVTYTLTLKVPGVSPDLQYSIRLNLRCENDPKTNYFANPDVNGRLKFEKFLQDQLAMDLGTQAIDKLIDEWCDDISVGYRNSEIEI